MTSTEAGTWGRPEAAAIEKIGRRLIDVGLGQSDSLLTPGQPIWTADHLEELKRDYSDRPDTGSGGFFEKLDHQLATTSSGAIQLFAELLIVNILPIINLSGALKLKQVQTILERCDPPVAIPDDVKQALLGGGVYHGGQAFGNYKWKQLVYLIEVAHYFKQLPEQRRVDALADPLIFRDEVDTVATGQAAQRQSLLYLAFPDFFLPIVSVEHRRLMRDAFAPEYLGRQIDDVDSDLHDIYEAIREKHGVVDLYASPWLEMWQKPKSRQPRPTDEVQHAWRVHGSNVKGQDMVPIWRNKGTVSLAASLLRPIQPGISRDELKVFVEEDYTSSGYAQRLEKLDEFYAFLARMHPGDLVVTVSQGNVYFGIITGEPESVKSSDGRSNMRRTTKWYGRSLPLSKLPDEVVARLSAQGEVLDLSQHLPTLLALAEHRQPPEGIGAVHLPDATPQLAQRLHVPVEWLQECVELLRDRPQLIFYGPPGTGKTYIAQELARHLTAEANVKIVQFHPAYTYEDFFEGYRPKEHGAGQVGFTLTPGPLRSLVDKAKDNPEAVYVLIIDEINRGNLAKVFGELYFLLEYRDSAIDLLYSADNTEPFSLPKNILIIGTMNTADRSIALVDAAMRRRFAFLPLHPSESPTNGILRKWLEATKRPNDVADLLDELNSRIEDPDFKIGPSYFMRSAVHAAGGKGLERVWRTAILPLLEEHHYGDGTDVRSRYGLDVIRKALQNKAAAGEAPQDTDGPAASTLEATDHGSTATVID
ncbi:McrB family protein [Mycobacterium sp. E3198]|uniref:McrB family protein n=1 Tax=Mycobacterium sp. E3198 TaxID=1834143 RepID=UPI0007FCAC59|nr:AAA family ATPase [Mycobacterium sp. E3198]OBG41513.1 AAA family ATPase [Mycobacterium sp. E3198]